MPEEWSTNFESGLAMHLFRELVRIGVITLAEFPSYEDNGADDKNKTIAAMDVTGTSNF